jgi:hypothetical protein
LRLCKPQSTFLCLAFFADKLRPAQQAAILLATYDFTNANKLFGYHLINSAPEKDTEESPFSSFLSLTSYLMHHAYRSPRVAYYAELNLFTLRILSEDSTSCKLLCSDESKRKVRLCRQRQPYLPLVTGNRVLATAIFDILIDAISHNLKRRLDVQLYRYVLSYSVNRLRLIKSNLRPSAIQSRSSSASSPTYP